MAASPTAGDLGTALDLISQPLLLEALAAIGDGKGLTDALPADTDGVTLDAALRRLAAIGAVRTCATGPFDRHELTPRGARLLNLLADLDALIVAEGAGRHEDRCGCC